MAIYRILIALLILTFSACGTKESSSDTKETAVKKISEESIFKTTVFDAGEDGIDSYRIPSMVTAKDGSLLVFTEARKESSVDKSPTDIVVKRSTDNGKTWSAMQTIAEGGENAFMDPTALVDDKTGKIFLFASLWPKDNHSGKENTGWLITSDDHGETWKKPQEITDLITKKNFYLNGFGPGSGVVLKGERFKNRLIIPLRLMQEGALSNYALYSDDHGETWEIGESTETGNEFMIAESPLDTLIYNVRAGKGKRVVGRSNDGGQSWSKPEIDLELQSSVDYGGVQGSMLGIENLLFFSAPAGGLGSKELEDRQNLMLYRSTDGGHSWKNKQLLYDKAAGYTSITRLKDGSLAIVFETADTESFPKLLPDMRPEGWMRLDVLILPKEVTDPHYWF